MDVPFPAIFGLTQEADRVFTANAFALLGLRQLYFLLDGLLDGPVFLAYGLLVILATLVVTTVASLLRGRPGSRTDAGSSSVKADDRDAAAPHFHSRTDTAAPEPAPFPTAG
jgi:hypothetical protein